MKVAIYVKDKTEDAGFVQYNESNHSLMVTHPDSEIRNRIRNYLKTPRRFTVPGGKEVGSRTIIVRKPIEDVSSLEMGLCEMFHAIGVHVDWNNPENEGGSTYEAPKLPDKTPPTTANKPIIKSLDDDIGYEIIN